MDWLSQVDVFDLSIEMQQRAQDVVEFRPVLAPGVAARPWIPLLVSTWTATAGFDCSGTGRPPANASTARGGRTFRVTVGAGVAASRLGFTGFVGADLCFSYGGFAAPESGDGKSVATGAVVVGVEVPGVGGASVALVPAGVVPAAGATVGSVCTASVSGCEPPTVVITL